MPQTYPRCPEQIKRAPLCVPAAICEVRISSVREILALVAVFNGERFPSRVHKRCIEAHVLLRSTRVDLDGVKVECCEVAHVTFIIDSELVPFAACTTVEVPLRSRQSKRRI